jgi:hypothetical protein
MVRCTAASPDVDRRVRTLAEFKSWIRPCFRIEGAHAELRTAVAGSGDHPRSSWYLPGREVFKLGTRMPDHSPPPLLQMKLG